MLSGSQESRQPDNDAAEMGFGSLTHTASLSRADELSTVVPNLISWFNKVDNDILKYVMVTKSTLTAALWDSAHPFESSVR